MLRRLFPSLFASALICASACEASTPDPKLVEAKPEAKTPEAKTKPKPKLEPMPTPEPDSTAAETPAGDRPPPPAWFDASKIEHEAIVSQIASDKPVGTGGWSSALILELAAGVTNDQCIEAASKALGETITDVPAATTAEDRMLLQGTTDGYSYMIVCGEAKGKRTLYLSYTTTLSEFAGAPTK